MFCIKVEKRTTLEGLICLGASPDTQVVIFPWNLSGFNLTGRQSSKGRFPEVNLPGGNILGAIFRGAIFRVVIFQVGNLLGGNHLGGNFMGGNFPVTVSLYVYENPKYSFQNVSSRITF